MTSSQGQASAPSRWQGQVGLGVNPCAGKSGCVYSTDYDFDLEAGALFKSEVWTDHGVIIDTKVTHHPDAKVYLRDQIAKLQSATHTGEDVSDAIAWFIHAPTYLLDYCFHMEKALSNHPQSGFQSERGQCALSLSVVGLACDGLCIYNRVCTQTSCATPQERERQKVKRLCEATTGDQAQRPFTSISSLCEPP